MRMNCIKLVAARLAPITAQTHSDDAIDHWGEIYRANPGIARMGVTFERFLAQPQRYLSATTGELLLPAPDEAQFYPLLPAQRAIQAALDEAAAFTTTRRCA